MEDINKDIPKDRLRFVMAKIKKVEQPDRMRVICGIIQEMFRKDKWDIDTFNILYRAMHLASTVGEKLTGYNRIKNNGEVKTPPQPEHPNRRYRQHFNYNPAVREETLKEMEVKDERKYGELFNIFNVVRNKTNNEEVKELCIEAAWMASKMIKKLLEYEKEQ